MTDNAAPPVVSPRDDCHRPHGCICQPDEPCQVPLWRAQVPVMREDEA